MYKQTTFLKKMQSVGQKEAFYRGKEFAYAHCIIVFISFRSFQKDIIFFVAHTVPEIKAKKIALKITRLEASVRFLQFKVHLYATS